MKRILFPTLLIFSFFSINAQNNIPDFGKIDKADLQMTYCSFEDNAEAMVLFDIGEFYCSINAKMIKPVMVLTERRMRIKILKEKGLSRANVHIRYYSFLNTENVTGITAQTYNLDGSGNIVITKLEKKLIYDKKINKRYSEIAFTLPEVKIGSVIEYKYTVEGAATSSWFFQNSIPVAISSLTVNFPEELEISCMPHCSLPLNSKVERKTGRDVQIYQMENVPALRDEPYISCDEDYLQHITARIAAVNFPRSPRVVLDRTWYKIVENLMDDIDFGVQLKRNIPRTDDLELLLKNITSPYKKMLAIHDYVRANMQWDGNDNIWAVEGVKSAWKDKKGTSGEINLILVNLLKDAGLNAHPVLVSTREHGRVNTFLPNYGQFNKVMAYIEMDDKKYVLDATEKFTPSWLIPSEVVLSEGLVIEKIEKNEWGWHTLWEPKEIFKNTIIVNAAIDSTGIMNGEAIVYSTDYARLERMPKLKEGKTAFIETFIKANNSGIKVDSVTIENEKNDSLPLIQKVRFTNTLAASGEYKYFTLNLFSGLEKNIFVADSRFSDIFFSYNQQISIIGHFAIPDNYMLEELPKNIRMMMPDTGIIFTRLAGADENGLSVRITIDFKKPVYGVDEYPEFKEFYKKLFALLSEQIVIRRKS